MTVERRGWGGWVVGRQVRRPEQQVGEPAGGPPRRPRGRPVQEVDGGYGRGRCWRVKVRGLR